MRSKNILQTAALGLTMSALAVQTATAQTVTAQAAPPTNIPISSVPFVISAPGTYVLTGDLNFPSRTPRL
jgi:hypothetical protein